MALKGDDLSERLLDFSARVINPCGALTFSVVARHICKQLLRAGTSVGANYEEARGAESRDDFVHKLGLSLKEMREAQYWLRVTQRAKLLSPDRLEEIVGEADELSRILARSIQTARNRSAASNKVESVTR